MLDTETTGLDWRRGHRVIEIGCVELVNRRLSGHHFHTYLNPHREVDAEAFAIHGLSNEFLDVQPDFAEIAEQWFDFINASELVIHNAEFDVGFLNAECRQLDQMPGVLEDLCSNHDTLDLARRLHPGQRNSLDALSRRYGVDHRERALHGALLDAEILADVFLAMTGGQTDLYFSEQHHDAKLVRNALRSDKVAEVRSKASNIVICANEAELEQHQEWLSILRSNVHDD